MYAKKNIRDPFSLSNIVYLEDQPERNFWLPVSHNVALWLNAGVTLIAIYSFFALPLDARILLLL